MVSSLLQKLARGKEARTIAIALVLILLVAGLGQFSLSRLTTLHDVITYTNVKHIPTLRVLNDLAANSERYRNLQSLTLLTVEPTLKEGVGKRVAIVKQKRQALWDEYLKNRASPDERVAFEPVAKAWEKYLDLSNRALAMYEAGDHENAVTLFNIDAQLAMDSYRAAFHTHLDFVTNQVQASADQVDALYAQSRLVIFFVFLFAVPMCLLAGITAASLWL